MAQTTFWEYAVLQRLGRQVALPCLMQANQDCGVDQWQRKADIRSGLRWQLLDHQNDIPQCMPQYV